MGPGFPFARGLYLSGMDAAGLRADCSRCSGLCCVLLPFARSADFAFDKPAGTPCLHLRADFRCRIHDTLRADGFAGCVAYDCFGAGQRATEVADGDPTVFATLRVLHELLWYLAEAVARASSTALRAAYERTEFLAARPAGVDAGAHRAAVVPLLRTASAAIRRDRSGPYGAGADLAGASLRAADLSDLDLRGAVLLRADLRGAVLTRTDLIGADLRDADLAGADLRDAIYLTRAQVGAARGDGTTRLPARLEHPPHWRRSSAHR
jgi:hypothetical protein